MSFENWNRFLKETLSTTNKDRKKQKPVITEDVKSDKSTKNDNKYFASIASITTTAFSEKFRFLQTKGRRV